jgi:hypothetical protein
VLAGFLAQGNIWGIDVSAMQRELADMNESPSLESVPKPMPPVSCGPTP